MCCVAWLVPALLLAIACVCEGFLNNDPDEIHHMVSNLRQQIFVEVAYLEERGVNQCSSLGGPGCLRSMLNDADPEERLRAPGVIPDAMTSDLPFEFTTPTFSELDWHRSQSIPDTTPAAGEAFQNARAEVEFGFMDFSGLVVGDAVANFFSEGFPLNVSATWQGSWHVQLSKTPLRITSLGTRAVSPTTRRKHVIVDDPPFASEIHLAAELSSSTGYIRFSEPVVIRSILAQWLPGNETTASAVIGGRLGLESVWATHLDPVQFHNDLNWVDINGDSLRVVDEIAIIAAPGIQIGALQIMRCKQMGDFLVPVLLMKPWRDGHSEIGGDVDDDMWPSPIFEMVRQEIAFAAAPLILSLQEATLHNLRLRPVPSPPEGNPQEVRRGEVPGCLVISEYDELAITQQVFTHPDNLTWYATALRNNKMFGHTLLPSLLGELHSAMASHADGGSINMAHVALFTDALVDPRSPSLPEALREEMKESRSEILEAVALLGPQASVNLKFLQTSVTLNSTLTAKELQTKLDLLTAAWLHSQPRMTMPRAYLAED